MRARLFLVRGSGPATVLDVSAAAVVSTKATRASGKLRQSGDLTVDLLAGRVKAKSLPKLAVAKPSVSALDQCAVAATAGVTVSAGPYRGARIKANLFGAQCFLENKNVYAYFDSSVAQPADAVGTRQVRVGLRSRCSRRGRSPAAT